MTHTPQCRICAHLDATDIDTLAGLGRPAMTDQVRALLPDANVSERWAREHLAHAPKPERHLIDGQLLFEAPGEMPDVVDAVDREVANADETQAAWFREQGINLPPGFVAGTIKQGDHWLRVKPVEAASTVDESVVAELRNRVHSWTRTPRVRGTRSTEKPCTLFVALADWQLGKGEGGGVAATVERITRGLQATAERVEELRNAGRNITQIAVANMGDPTEGCEGNYAQQLFTTELNMRDQLTLALDLQLAWIRTLAPLAPAFSFSSVLCNHGELSRRGGKSVTDNADNAGGLLADTLRRVLDGRPEYAHIEWLIPRDEMVIMPTYSGIPTALAHGHTMSGKEDAWLNAQSIRLLREHKTEPRLWVLAHRHHLSVTDFGPYTRIQCPSNDGGSAWYTNTSGKWSTPGTLTCLIGEHDVRGWSDLALL